MVGEEQPMNPTNDPNLKSFVAVASDSHFPIQNLPYGLFQPRAGGESHLGVAIGDDVLDLSLLEQRGLLQLDTAKGMRPFSQQSLNPFMALGPTAWHEARAMISHLLQANVSTLRDNDAIRREALIPLDDVKLLLPIEIGDYTDFYSSREHATNVGRMMRGADNALLPNWLHMPIAYHGRASSVVVSGTDIRRPLGQRSKAGSETPEFGPSRAMDFELEVGFVVGVGNPLGKPISTSHAADHVFGVVLVNDWSARDIQKWEYQPLGPFLSKNLATSISPWVVPMEALEPFCTQGPHQDPTPLPYLMMPNNPTFDVRLEAYLQTEQMEHAERICVSNLRYLYWNIFQQVAHHTITGCNLRTGDLLATGTVSGPEADSLGCLLEISEGGKKPLKLPDGEQRIFLQDNDRVTLTAWGQGDRYRVGFGEVTGKLLGCC
jgi:fumarylacetoacetase